MHWGKVTIVGVGLLGGSIGMALKKRNLAGDVVGYVRRKAAVREVIKAGAVDTAGTHLLEGIRGADLIILCTPITEMEPLVRQMCPAVKPGAIVTDVGSVKVPVVQRLREPLRKAGSHFVGSHPMAGSEKGGIGAARADLFCGAVCVVTRDRKSNVAATRKTAALWRSLGSRVLTMESALHDRLVSRASHLPHMVAALLAEQVLDPRQDGRQAKLCATGFRDTTRVAASSPGMWRDIAMANRTNLIRDLALFEANLAGLRQALVRGDVSRLDRFLSVARKRRMDWDGDRVSGSQE